MSIPKLGYAVGFGALVAIAAFLAMAFVTGRGNLDAALGIGAVAGAAGWAALMLRDALRAR